MNFRSLGTLIGASAMLLGATTNNASAQTGNPFTKSSSGLTLSVLKSDAAQNKITLQFNLANDTKARVYVRDAVNEASQRAFLGSGAQLSSPQSVGIEGCYNSVSTCLSNPNEAADLNKFSYIEPGESVAFSFAYQSQIPVSDTDTVSFSVAIVARSTKPNGDPSETGPPQAVRFSFPYMPLNRR